MEFSYENIKIGYLFDCSLLGLICNADTKKIEVEYYEQKELR